MKKGTKKSKKKLMYLMYYLAWAVGILAALILIYGIITSIK